jgi:hypothetical protein
MKRDLERRLAQAETPEINRADREAARRRQELRAIAELRETLRQVFRRVGIDPERVWALRAEGQAAELAAIPDTPDLKAADEAMLRLEDTHGEDEAGPMSGKITALVERYRSGELQLNIEHASLADVYAFARAMLMEADKLRASRLGPTSGRE